METYPPFMPLDVPGDKEVWAISPSGGAIVSNKAQAYGFTDPQNVAWYGGYLICESLTQANAERICKLYNGSKT